MKKEKEKIKKPWYKRKLIWAIIIIVFIMAIGSNGEYDKRRKYKAEYCRCRYTATAEYRIRRYYKG